MSVAIFDDEGDYGAVIVSGANLAITPDQASDELLRHGKVLVLQNEIPELVNEAVARRARERGLTIIINAAPARAFATSLADLIDVLVVNSIEAEMLGGGRVILARNRRSGRRRACLEIQGGRRHRGR